MNKQVGSCHIIALYSVVPINVCFGPASSIEFHSVHLEALGVHTFGSRADTPTLQSVEEQPASKEGGFCLE